MSRLTVLQKSIERFSEGDYTIRDHCAVAFLNQSTQSQIDMDKVCDLHCTPCTSLIKYPPNLSDFLVRMNLGRLDV